MRNIYKIFGTVLLIIIISACTDLLTPSSKQSKSLDQGVKTEKDLKGLINGVYDQLADYTPNFLTIGAVRSDNAFSTGATGRFTQESSFEVTPSSGGWWEDAYEAIAVTNIIINSKVPDSPMVNYIKGQAHALRAKIHMDLLMRYGQEFVDGSDKGIPYITTYNEGNLFPSRGTVQETWDKIGVDFQQAISMMSPKFDGSNTTLTYYGARALQARFFLATDNFKKSVTAAKDVIDSGNYQITSAGNYESAWATDGSKNSVFELAFTASGGGHQMGNVTHDPAFGDVEVTKDLFDLYDVSDVRLDLFTKSKNSSGINIYRIVGKYPKLTGLDNVRIIRYAEVVLTYAETQAELGNQSEAKIYLDKITSNRNVSDYSIASVGNIRLERRKELAMEGHRFFDLMRAGQGVKRDVPVRNAFDVSVPFGSYRLAYPIPQSELDANGNLTQNKGY